MKVRLNLKNGEKILVLRILGYDLKEAKAKANDVNIIEIDKGIYEKLVKRFGEFKIEKLEEF